MAIIKTKAQQNTAVARVSEGDDVYARATRDGSLFVANWRQALVMEGRGFMINVGTLSSPATGGGTAATAVDEDAPEITVAIPKGTSMIPLRIEISAAEPTGVTDDNEVDFVIAVDQDTAASTGTAVAEVIYNMNTLHPRSSNCTAKSEYTATMTSAVLDLELAHYTKIFEIFDTTGGFWQESFLLYEPKTPPIINGPATLVIFWGGTVAVKAFASVQWLELPTSVI